MSALPDSIQTMGDLLQSAARQWKKSVFLVDGKSGTEMTFGICYQRAISLAHALRFQLNVSHGDPVAVVSPNCLQYVELYFGNALNASCTANVAPQLAPIDMIKVINNTRARVLFVHPDYVEVYNQIRYQLDYVEITVYFSTDVNIDPPFDYIHYQRLLNLHSDTSCDRSRLDNGANEHDAFAMFLTSGTTSTPKAVVRSHYATLSRRCLERFQYGDTWIVNNSFAWMGSMLLIKAAALYGGRLVITNGFEEKEYLHLMDHYRVNCAFLMPQVIVSFSKFARNSEFCSIVQKNLRFCMYGGAPVSASVLEKFLDLYPEARMYQIYGTTESHMGTVLHPQDHRRPASPEVLSSVGKPLPDVGVVVMRVDETGCPPHPAKIREIGEIWINNNARMTEYFHNEKATSESMPKEFPGWYRTGDVGYFDEMGYLHVKSRLRDMIVVGSGYNVYATDVEEVLSQHPMVEAVSVVGLVDPDGLEHVTAFVVPRKHPRSLHKKSPSTSEVTSSFSLKFHVFSPRPMFLSGRKSVSVHELIRFCDGKLSDYQTPEAIYFMDRLPMNHNQKVLKRKLREPTGSSVNLFKDAPPTSEVFANLKKCNSCGVLSIQNSKWNPAKKTVSFKQIC